MSWEFMVCQFIWAACSMAIAMVEGDVEGEGGKRGVGSVGGLQGHTALPCGGHLVGGGFEDGLEFRVVGEQGAGGLVVAVPVAGFEVVAGMLGRLPVFLGSGEDGNLECERDGQRR